MRYLDKIPKQLENREYHPIKGFPKSLGIGGIPIIYSDSIPPTVPSKIDFEDVEKNKLCAYSTSNPKDWEVYFGFVKPVQVPNFLMIDDHKTSVTHEVWRNR